MNRIPTFLLLVLALCSCQEKSARRLSPKEMDRQADSIAGSQYREMKRQYEQDLEMQLAVEGQQRADSILTSRRKPGDTVMAAPPPPVVSDTQRYRPAMPPPMPIPPAGNTPRPDREP